LRRHAADPWLTNKDGKQEAQEDDDERETEQHVNPISADGCGRPGPPGRRIRDIQPNVRTRPMSRGERRLTHSRRCIIIRSMNTQLKPVAALINLATATGATG